MKGLFVTLSMFSKIPVPSVSWDNKNMKYIFLFLPIIGAIIGTVLFMWYRVAVLMQLSSVLFAVIATVIPIMITGGIHLDGFIDTVDALSSNSDKEKKVEILKDPHVGAFGVIMCVVYIAIQTGLWNEIFINPVYLKMALISFVISRVMGGLAAANLPLAKNTGLGKIFSDGTDKKPVLAGLCLYIIIISTIVIYKYKLIGIGVISLNIILLFWYKQMAEKNFGGITGDLSGYYIEIIEIAVLAMAAICT